MPREGLQRSVTSADEIRDDQTWGRRRPLHHTWDGSLSTAAKIYQTQKIYQTDSGGENTFSKSKYKLCHTMCWQTEEKLSVSVKAINRKEFEGGIRFMFYI